MKIAPPFLHPSFGTFTADALGNLNIAGTENLDALLGYEQGDQYNTYPAKARVNDGEPVDVLFLGDAASADALLEGITVASGDVVEIIGTINPARTDVEQGTVTATATVA